jgi:hypothetical protein
MADLVRLEALRLAHGALSNNKIHRQDLIQMAQENYEFLMRPKKSSRKAARKPKRGK